MGRTGDAAKASKSSRWTAPPRTRPSLSPLGAMSIMSLRASRCARRGASGFLSTAMLRSSSSSRSAAGAENRAGALGRLRLSVLALARRRADAATSTAHALRDSTSSLARCVGARPMPRHMRNGVFLRWSRMNPRSSPGGGEGVRKGRTGATTARKKRTRTGRAEHARRAAPHAVVAVGVVDDEVAQRVAVHLAVQAALERRHEPPELPLREEHVHQAKHVLHLVQA